MDEFHAHRQQSQKSISFNLKGKKVKHNIYSDMLCPGCVALWHAGKGHPTLRPSYRLVEAKTCVAGRQSRLDRLECLRLVNQHT